MNALELEVQRAMRIIAGWFGCADEAKGRTPDELGRFLYERERASTEEICKRVREITEKRLAGSAETGGEKAAWISVGERMPEDDDTSVWVCFENGSHYCSARFADEKWWGYNLETEDTFEIEQQITHWMPLPALATLPRSSQNQTASSGVEGAHEGTTADESGSRGPEKLNNAQKWIVPASTITQICHEFYMTAPNTSEQQTDKLQQILEVALAESSLSSPPLSDACTYSRFNHHAGFICERGTRGCDLCHKPSGAVCGVKIMGNMVWFMDSDEPPRQVSALERKLITALLAK